MISSVEKTRGRGDPVTANDVVTWQSKMASVVLDTITEDEIKEIMKAILERAKRGDLAAARLILSYAVGSPQRQLEMDGPAPRAKIDGPTPIKGGTKAKLDVLAYRAANGIPLHQNGDGGEVDLS